MIKHLKDLKITYYIILIIFILTFIISALLAYYTPYSGRGFVEYDLYPIYNKIGGKIEDIYVKDSQNIDKDTMLFKLDNTKYKLDLEKLKYQYKTEENRLIALDYKILKAQKEVLKVQEKLENTKINYSRYKSLYIDEVIPKAEFERYELSYKTTQREFEIANLSVVSLKKERGKLSKENEFLKSLESQIKKAQKNLKDTIIRAIFTGKLSIHQFYKGQFVDSNRSYGYIYNSKNLNIYVDYMEKSLINLKNGQKALVTFDAIPGEVFKGHVEKVTSILKSGYTSPEKLQEIKKDTRWIRTTGKGKVKIILDEKLPSEANINSDSKVAVNVMSEKHGILSGISHIWMKVISIINYIY